MQPTIDEKIEWGQAVNMAWQALCPVWAKEGKIPPYDATLAMAEQTLEYLQKMKAGHFKDEPTPEPEMTLRMG